MQPMFYPTLDPRRAYALAQNPSAGQQWDFDVRVAGTIQREMALQGLMPPALRPENPAPNISILLPALGRARAPQQQQQVQRFYGVDTMAGAQLGQRANPCDPPCPGQICCPDGACVDSISACATFTADTGRAEGRFYAPSRRMVARAPRRGARQRAGGAAVSRGNRFAGSFSPRRGNAIAGQQPGGPAVEARALWAQFNPAQQDVAMRTGMNGPPVQLPQLGPGQKPGRALRQRIKQAVAAAQHAQSGAPPMSVAPQMGPPPPMGPPPQINPGVFISNP